LSFSKNTNIKRHEAHYYLKFKIENLDGFFEETGGYWERKKY